MTLIEVMTAGGISSFVLAGMMAMIWDIGRTQRVSIADAALHQKAAILQDTLVSELRFMDASESVIYGDATTRNGAEVYEKIVVALGDSTEYPRESYYYDPDDEILYHDPDVTVSGDEEIVFESDDSARLSNVYFYPGLKTGGALNSSIINVWMELNDNYSSGREDSYNEPVLYEVTRSFAIYLINGQ